jgi:hypothetical protein
MFEVQPRKPNYRSHSLFEFRDEFRKRIVFGNRPFGKSDFELHARLFLKTQDGGNREIEADRFMKAAMSS